MPIASGPWLHEEIQILDLLGTLVAANASSREAVRIVAQAYNISSFCEPLGLIHKRMGDEDLSLGAAMRGVKGFSGFVPSLVLVGEEIGEPNQGLSLASTILERIHYKRSGRAISEISLLPIVDLYMIALLKEADRPTGVAVEAVFKHTSSDLKDAWGRVLHGMGGSQQLSIGMECANKNGQDKDVFDPWIIEFVRVGEINNVADVVVAKVADHLLTQLLDF